MATFALIAAVGHAPIVQALGLGQVKGEAIVGEALHLTIPLTGGAMENVDSQCIALGRTKDVLDPEYFPRDLAARVETRAGGRTLVLTGRSALRQPVVEFRVSVGCGYNLHHDYLLMASPRAGQAAPPVAGTPPVGVSAMVAALPAASSVAGERPEASGLPDGLDGKVLLIERETTLQALARRHYPGPLRQERFMRWVVEANPGLVSGQADVRNHRLVPGQKLLIPDGVPPRRPGDHRHGAQLAGDLGAASVAAGVSAPQVKQGGTAARFPAVRPDRLVIGAAHGGRDFTETMGIVNRLTGMLEQQVSTQSTHDERILAMENALTELRATLAQLASQDQQRLAALRLEQEETARQLADRGGQSWWQLLWAVVFGAGLVTGLVALARRIGTKRSSGETSRSVVMAETTVLNTDPRPRASGRQAPVMDLPLDVGAAPLAPAARVAAAKPVAQVRARVDEPVDEAAAAIELVNIMTSMGLAASAAETLVNHIREKPRQSLHHWLKLFELYRLNNDQAGFERTAEELRAHYNVRPATWLPDIAPADGSSIEVYPHLRAELIERWRQSDCAKFLHSLLADNRNGTRAGFPVIVAEEILLLIAVRDAVAT